MKAEDEFIAKDRVIELMKEAFEAGRYLQRHASRGSSDCPYWSFLEWYDSKGYCDITTQTKFPCN